MRHVQSRRSMRGMTLVELMVGAALALFLMAGIGSVFVTTGQTSRTNENLSRLQEAARTAFTLMSRDIREAGLNDCGRIDRVVNVLTNAAATPWANWNQGIEGVDENVALTGVTIGTGVGERVASTDAFRIMGGASDGVSVANHNPASATIFVTDSSTFADGDVVVVCDFTQASIFQITNTGGAAMNVEHNTGAAVSPGNCSKGLGYKNPPLCTALGQPYTYLSNSKVMRFKSDAWYVGNNGRAASGGTSLFRQSARRTGTAVAPMNDEILEGVTGMQLGYLEDGDDQYRDAAAIGNWADVVAVRIQLTLNGVEAELGATGGMERVNRVFTHVVSLRNRVP